MISLTEMPLQFVISLISVYNEANFYFVNLLVVLAYFWLTTPFFTLYERDLQYRNDLIVKIKYNFVKRNISTRQNQRTSLNYLKAEAAP